MANIDEIRSLLNKFIIEKIIEHEWKMEQEQ